MGVAAAYLCAATRTPRTRHRRRLPRIYLPGFFPYTRARSPFHMEYIGKIPGGIAHARLRQMYAEIYTRAFRPIETRRSIRYGKLAILIEIIESTFSPRTPPTSPAGMCRRRHTRHTRRTRRKNNGDKRKTRASLAAVFPQLKGVWRPEERGRQPRRAMKRKLLNKV